MFDVTFLGHQGWCFSAAGARILVDPILTEDFCEAGRVGKIYPPREFDFDRFPPVDAVFFSHEHNDHFAVPTLARLDRRIPIYLSARASVAARALLSEMGFSVRLLAAGATVEIGALAFHASSPDHVVADNHDEWDVLPFLVRERDGHGSFFSHVDVEPSERAEQGMRRHAERPGLWCATNNVSSWTFMEAGVVSDKPPLHSAGLAGFMLSQHAALERRWGPPAGVLFCGGGMSFGGDREWLNRKVFTADSERVAAAMSAAIPGRMHLAPAPGQTVRLRAGTIVEVSEHCEFLRATPRATWPSREFVGDVSVLKSYAPACGRSDFDERDLPELTRGLAGFARFLYGGRTFRSLYSLDREELGARRPTFSLVALADAGSGAYVYEYDPQGCRFAAARDVDPVNDYVGGLEFWATDLLAICRGELASSAIPFGRGRIWNALPERCEISFREFCLYFHPLRQPDLFLTLYRSLLRAEPALAPVVRARS